MTAGLKNPLSAEFHHPLQYVGMEGCGQVMSGLDRLVSWPVLGRNIPIYQLNEKNFSVHKDPLSTDNAQFEIAGKAVTIALGILINPRKFVAILILLLTVKFLMRNFVVDESGFSGSASYQAARAVGWGGRVSNLVTNFFGLRSNFF